MTDSTIPVKSVDKTYISFEGNIGSGKSTFVKTDMPSWVHKKDKNYSGLDDHSGTIEIDEGSKRIARKVRKALSELAIIIAENIK